MTKRTSSRSPMRNWRSSAANSDASTFLDSPSPRENSRNASDGLNNISVQPEGEEMSTAAEGRVARRAPKRRRGDNIRRGDGDSGGAVARTGRELVRFAQRVRVPAVVREPEMIMQIATITTISGGVCFFLVVFYGPALVFLAVITVGLCGMGYSIRERGLIRLLPSGVVELLTHTTLLEFLTDTSVFDAVKNYLVFMMGLSPEETQRVLHTLPENMQATLTRPGLLHTLPPALQSLLNGNRAWDQFPRFGNEDQGGRRRHRRRRRLRNAEEEEARSSVYDGGAGGQGHAACAGGRVAFTGDGAAQEEIPLGLLVWNPVSIDGRAAPPANIGGTEGAGRSNGYRGNGEHHRHLEREQHPARVGGVEVGDIEYDDSDDGNGIDNNDEDSDDATAAAGHRNEQGQSEGDDQEGREDDEDDEEEDEEDDEEDEEDEEDDEEDDEEEAIFGDNERGRRNLDNNTRGHASVQRRPWDSPSVRSRRPPRLGRSNSDGGRSVEHPASPAQFEGSRRRAVSSAHGGERRPITEGLRAGLAGGGGAAVAGVGGMMPSPERIVASILQARVDSAVRAAWNVVDQRRVRRAAIGSGVALAAHVVFSERARRQAGSMLRGSVLAALAGTGTVCAGLAYFNPTTQAANADADADSDADSAGPPRTQPNAPRTAVAAADPPPLRRRWYGDDSAVRRGSALDAAPVRVRENGSRDLRLTIFRAGLRRWIANLSPNAQRLVRVLGLVCLLLAVRKWQVLRRAALRAAAPRIMYGSVSR